MSGLTENSWILISISVFNLLLYGFLLKVYEENQCHTVCSYERDEYFNGLSDIYRYAMILHQKFNKEQLVNLSTQCFSSRC